MLGASLLVAPKITRGADKPPKKFFQWSDDSAGRYTIDVYLPPKDLWYFYSSKEVMVRSEDIREIKLNES